MQLTTEQQATLRAFVQADPALSLIQPGSDGAFAIADALKAEATPAFWVWRTSVEKKEIVEGASRNGTVFTWAGNGFITRSQGERDCWEQLFNSTLTTNPALPNVRQAFVDIFSGTGNAALNRTHLDAVSRRKANRLEKLFATGTGADSSAGAGTMAVEGSLSYQEVQTAMGW